MFDKIISWCLDTEGRNELPLNLITLQNYLVILRLSTPKKTKKIPKIVILIKTKLIPFQVKFANTITKVVVVSESSIARRRTRRIIRRRIIHSTISPYHVYRFVKQNARFHSINRHTFRCSDGVALGSENVFLIKNSKDLRRLSLQVQSGKYSFFRWTIICSVFFSRRRIWCRCGWWCWYGWFLWLWVLLWLYRGEQEGEEFMFFSPMGETPQSGIETTLLSTLNVMERVAIIYWPPNSPKNARQPTVLPFP